MAGLEIYKGKSIGMIIWTGVTSNGNQEIIDVIQTFSFCVGTMSLIVQRTAGADNTIDVNIQTSIDGNTWTELTNLTVTAKDTEDRLPDGTNRLEGFRYIMADVDDVGSGNTLDIYLLLEEVYRGAE